MKILDEIAKRIAELEGKIAKAMESGEIDTELKLKKRLYKLKIEAIETLQKEADKEEEMSAMELIEKVKSLPKRPKYLTGVEALDAPGTLEGFESGTFVQIAGASGAGKTTLAMQILANVARYERCYLFSYEMGMRRSAYRLEKLLATEAQRKNLKVRLKGNDIEVIEKIVRIRAREGYRFFVIDSKMKIEHEGHAGKEHEKWSAVSTRLAILCQELDVILILINQISEESEKTGRFALKGSGDQKYDADVILFVVKDEKSGGRVIHCTKNRQENERLYSRPWTLEQEPNYTEVVYEMPQIA
ncbi:RAD55 family ATPase [Hydrogenimonas sp.]